MGSIQDTYIKALLADATYAANSRDGDRDGLLVSRLSARMTPTLAEFITANFEVAAHKENDDTFGSGFDATVWRGKAETSYAGKVYVSMQGTAGLGDFLTDIDLSTSGGARLQFVDMVNWWLQITTPAGAQARQIRQAPSLNLHYFEEAPAVQGAGLLLGAMPSDGTAEPPRHSGYGGGLRLTAVSPRQAQIASVRRHWLVISRSGRTGPSILPLHRRSETMREPRSAA